MLFLGGLSLEPIPAVNRQANRHWREDKHSDRQAGRGRLVRQEGCLQRVGDCASFLTWARKSSLPSGPSPIRRPSRRLVLQPVTRGAVVIGAIDRVG